MKEISKKI